MVPWTGWIPQIVSVWAVINNGFLCFPFISVILMKDLHIYTFELITIISWEAFFCSRIDYFINWRRSRLICRHRSIGLFFKADQSDERGNQAVNDSYGVKVEGGQHDLDTFLMLYRSSYGVCELRLKWGTGCRCSWSYVYPLKQTNVLLFIIQGQQRSTFISLHMCFYPVFLIKELLKSNAD